jgi:hypothetical protein
MDDYTIEEIDEAMNTIHDNFIEDRCLSVEEEAILYRTLLMLSDLKKIKIVIDLVGK